MFNLLLAAKCGISQDYLESGCSLLSDLCRLSSLIRKKRRPNQGNRQHPPAKDILELTSFKDVVNEDVVVYQWNRQQIASLTPGPPGANEP